MANSTEGNLTDVELCFLANACLLQVRTLSWAKKTTYTEKVTNDLKAAVSAISAEVAADLGSKHSNALNACQINVPHIQTTLENLARRRLFTYLAEIHSRISEAVDTLLMTAVNAGTATEQFRVDWCHYIYKTLEEVPRSSRIDAIKLMSQECSSNWEAPVSKRCDNITSEFASDLKKEVTLWMEDYLHMKYPALS